jgi:peptide/nickel transport system substrate-binding protein
LRRISAELDVEKRRALIGELVGITRNDMVYLPLHQQPITWASKKGVDLKQGPDNQLRLRLVTTP